MRALGLSALLLTVVGCSETGLNGRTQDSPEIHNAPDVPERVVDEFMQAEANEADVLFVISNWWSMDQAYAELVDNFDDLLNVLIGSGVNYHIGVISTDTDHFYETGKLHEANGVKFITPQTPDPLDTFAEMATMNASGCVGPRRPRDAAYLALEVEVDAANAGFRRDDASMHTIFVSDDRDVSYRLSLEEWIDWYQGYTKTPELDSLSTIVDFSKDEDNIYASDVIGGATHPIQEYPWRNVVEEIGLRAQGLRTEFSLSRQPVPETIEVEAQVDGSWLTFEAPSADSEGDWWYDASRNSVHFRDFEAPEGAEIQIGYEAI